MSEPEAFDFHRDVFELCDPLVRRTIRYFRDRGAASRESTSDLVQDVWLRAISNSSIRRACPEDRRRLVRRIARSVAIDSTRRNRSRKRDQRAETGGVSKVADEQATASQELVKREQTRMLATCIDALPGELKDVLILVSVEGMSLETVATQLGQPASTIRSRYARARTRLFQMLRSRGTTRQIT